MSAEAEVQQASDQFYAALNSMVNGDASPMAEIWSHESDVSTMHPLGRSRERLARGARLLGGSGAGVLAGKRGGERPGGS